MKQRFRRVRYSEPAMRLLSLLILLGVSSTSPALDYGKDVKPIFAGHCYSCHGALQQKAGLRLDTAKAMIQGGDNGPAVVPKKPAESLLLKHVRADDGHELMPPRSDGEPLSARQIETIIAWIEGGAIAPANETPETDPKEHWAFRAPVRPKVPGNGNPVDAFIDSKLKSQGLKAMPSAEKRLLLRRVSLDLIGLPPTTEEYDSFEKDRSPDAFEKVVDRLLASPQYGERWGRHFMDIWRYSDGWGLSQELRSSHRHLWHWRDWIIESLNADLGYDEMVRDMLSADERHPADPAKLRATGFLARQYYKFNRTTWLDETIEHTGKAFLGLTFNCAKCHDHKYDPIRQIDYYRLRAFFEPYQLRTDFVPGEMNAVRDGIARAFDANLDEKTFLHIRGDDRNPQKEPLPPGLPPLLATGELKIHPVTLPREAYAPQLDDLRLAAMRKVAQREGGEAVKVLEARIEAEKLRIEGSKAFDQAAKAAARLEREYNLSKAKAALEAAEREIGEAPESKKVEATKHRDAMKKAFDTSKKAAEATDGKYSPLQGTIRAAESPTDSKFAERNSYPKTSTGRRTALADWITDRKNPLTARVMVNHLWLRHFGSPLVPTVFDFGRKGTLPTHPELLDWLAVEFMETGWSLKRMHKLMVTSELYRRSSDSNEAMLKLDPENAFYWRQNRQRMESQVVRDSLLSLSGELDRKIGGPSIDPVREADSKRRSIYFLHSYNDRQKFLEQFDDANVLDCYRRGTSIVPQQALAMSNSKFAVAVTESIAKRFAGAGSDEGFVTAAYLDLLGTKPNAVELAACREAMEEWRKVLNVRGTNAKARANLVHTLVNSNDFITVR
jgi:hypothetical protein